MCGEHPSSEACPYSCRTAMGSCSYRIEDTPPSSYTCSPVHEETEGEHTLHVPKIKIKISRDDHSIEVQNVQKRAKRDEEEELRIDEDVTSTAEELISRCKAFWAREPLRQENVTSCNILGYPVVSFEEQLFPLKVGSLPEITAIFYFTLIHFTSSI